MGLLKQEKPVNELSAERSDRVMRLRQAFLEGSLSLEIPPDAPGFDRLLLEIFAARLDRTPLRCLPYRSR